MLVELLHLPLVAHGLEVLEGLHAVHVLVSITRIFHGCVLSGLRRLILGIFLNRRHRSSELLVGLLHDATLDLRWAQRITARHPSRRLTRRLLIHVRLAFRSLLGAL